MIYTPPIGSNLFATITYGSRLYGTQTPTSDYDFKCVYLPSKRDILLAKPLKVERYRFDADGKIVGNSDTMPANGYEAEHTPIQNFLSAFLSGQAYAVEFVFAVLQGFHLDHVPPIQVDGFGGSHRMFCFEHLCKVMQASWVHQNVGGMTGFAAKQTMDYVQRGQRLNAARAVLEAVDKIQAHFNEQFAGLNVSETPALRLDTLWSAPPDVRVLDELVQQTGLEIGEAVNRDQKMRTLKLNGREYLETTTLQHFRTAVQKLVDQYGERSTRASEVDVDWKSLSHAVRVYQQVLELLDTRWITFPRPNAAKLLTIKNGELSLDSVKELLEELDLRVLEALADTDLPKVDDKFRSTAESALFSLLEGFY